MQRVIAGASIAAVLAGGVVLVFSDEPWWAILLWELALLVALFLLLALWSSAADDAREAAALVAAGTKVPGEILDKTVYDDNDTVYHLLTVRVALPDGGFEARHRCRHAECTSLEPGERVTVIVDPKSRAWAVLHQAVESLTTSVVASSMCNASG